MQLHQQLIPAQYKQKPNNPCKHPKCQQIDINTLLYQDWLSSFFIQNSHSSKSIYSCITIQRCISTPMVPNPQHNLPHMHTSNFEFGYIHIKSIENSSIKKLSKFNAVELLIKCMTLLLYSVLYLQMNKIPILLTSQNSNT